MTDKPIQRYARFDGAPLDGGEMMLHDDHLEALKALQARAETAEAAETYWWAVHTDTFTALQRANVRSDAAEAQLADAWFAFLPAYNASHHESGIDGADWWDLMNEAYGALAPKDPKTTTKNRGRAESAEAQLAEAAKLLWSIESRKLLAYPCAFCDDDDSHKPDCELAAFLSKHPKERTDAD